MIEEQTVCIVSVSNMIEEQTVKPFVTILYDDIIQYYTVRYNTIRHDTEKFNAILYDMMQFIDIKTVMKTFKHSNTYTMQYDTI